MPDLSLENKIDGVVVGVDEVGRGPWAGPVVVAAVILDRNNIPMGIDDSKKISAKKREQLFHEITATSKIAYALASVKEIDDLNILGATKLAMQRAVAALNIVPQMVLIDGNQLPKLAHKMQAVVKGDSISLSIAAASIVAKFTRDSMMQELAKEFPFYGWEKNAGYGTALHIAGIEKYGICKHHRRSFKPIAKFANSNID